MDLISIFPDLGVLFVQKRRELRQRIDINGEHAMLAEIRAQKTNKRYLSDSFENCRS